ncbi:uncharacterized protein LOC9656172 isoform X1 [Selaginella moellendorffii]|nr:uncharacterized protein LOC9656172 isoform X1 [Selaginella moellendorffii]|eukprot:XP_002977635.2 uncharacterized protein LOC9656172 isoform X1 [Selaginella moellendorffii]
MIKWPQGLAKFMLLCIALFTGLLLGVLASLHMSDYLNLRRGFLSANPGSGCYTSSSSIDSLKFAREWLWGGFPVKHNVSDPELLWLASLAPLRQGPPVKKIRKVAFLFMTRGPLPLAPLWEMFFRGNEGRYSIYIHALPGFAMDLPKTSVFYGRHIPSQDTQWGEITMCDAERRLVANALLDHSNHRFVLLSESCAPLHNFTTFYRYVIKSQHSFVGVFDDPGPFGRGRYSTNMLPEVKLEQWRKGSQWFEMERKLALHLVADNKYYPKFRDFCRPACYVDEHYIPTMLSIEFGSALANRSLTAVDWSRGGAHPAMFGRDDVTPEFLDRLRRAGDCSYNGRTVGTCLFFARKFSPNALEPLLRLLRDQISSI